MRFLSSLLLLTAAYPKMVTTTLLETKHTCSFEGTPNETDCLEMLVNAGGRSDFNEDAEPATEDQVNCIQVVKDKCKAKISYERMDPKTQKVKITITPETTDSDPGSPKTYYLVMDVGAVDKCTAHATPTVKDCATWFVLSNAKVTDDCDSMTCELATEHQVFCASLLKICNTHMACKTIGMTNTKAKIKFNFKQETEPKDKQETDSKDKQETESKDKQETESKDKDGTYYMCTEVETIKVLLGTTCEADWTDIYQ